MSMRKSLLWSVFGQAILFSSQMSAQVMIARYLSPYLVGIAAVAFSISDFVNLMQTFGLRNFLIRESEMDQKVVSTVFTVNLLLSLIVATLVMAISFWGGAFYHEPGVGRVLMIIALTPVAMSFELIPGALLQRNMRFGQLAVVNSVKAAVTAATSITMVILGFEYMSIGYGALAGAVASALLTCILGRHYLTWRLTLVHWRAVTKFGMHMLGVGGVSNAASRAIELVIGRMLGLASLGLFTRASALNNVLWGNIHTLFTKVVFSSMAEEWRNTGSIRDIYLKTADLVTATLWPAFAGLAVISGPVVHLLYGDKWVDAGPILAIFAIAAIILTANTMTWEVFVVCERTGEQAKIEVARAVLALLSTTIGCFFSIGGAALGRVADASVAYAMYRRRLNELTDTHTSEILSIYARNSALTLVAIAPAVITMSIFSWDPRTPLGWISAGIAVGVVLWALASRYLNQTLAYELSWMLGRVRGRLGILRA